MPRADSSKRKAFASKNRMRTPKFSRLVVVVTSFSIFHMQYTKQIILSIINLLFGLEIEQQLPSLWFEIFNILRFVQNQVFPFLSSETLVILYDQFVWCDAYMECIHFCPADTLLFAFFLWTIVCENLKTWTPFFEFHFPIEHHGRWHHNQMWTPITFHTCQMSE